MGKINWLLILQGWAMLWVVIGHSTLVEIGLAPKWDKMLYDIAYSFHMPLFMLISGYLFFRTRLLGVWSYRDIIKDKSIRLLLPGLVFSVLAYILKLVFAEEMNRTIEQSIKDLFYAYLFPFDNPLRELWFIVTLFWFFVLTPLWKIVLRNTIFIWLILVLLTVSHFINAEIDFLCIGRVFRFGIWFYVGLLISKFDLVTKLFERKLLLLFIAGIVTYVVSWYVHPFFSTIGGILTSFAIALLLNKYMPRTFFSFRNYTYQIFLIGIFAQIFVKLLFRNIEIPYLLAYLLCVMFGIYVPVSVSRLLLSINYRPLLLCVGLKK